MQGIQLRITASDAGMEQGMKGGGGHVVAFPPPIKRTSLAQVSACLMTGVIERAFTSL